MKKFIIPLIVVLLIGFGIYLVSKPPSMKGVSDSEAQFILFWGEGCPHCKNVEDYISQNKVEEKVKISYKEVYYNKTNQNLMTETVKKCPEIDTTQGMGVPLGFATAEQKCYYGDTPIIDWLKSAMLQ